MKQAHILNEAVVRPNDDVVDLGAASIETKGPPGQIVDFLGAQGQTSLSHDD